MLLFLLFVLIITAFLYFVIPLLQSLYYSAITEYAQDLEYQFHF